MSEIRLPADEKTLALFKDWKLNEVVKNLEQQSPVVQEQIRKLEEAQRVPADTMRMFFPRKTRR